MKQIDYEKINTVSLIERMNNIEIELVDLLKQYNNIRLTLIDRYPMLEDKEGFKEKRLVYYEGNRN